MEKLTVDQSSEYIKQFMAYHANNRQHQRIGQIAYNVLHDDLCESIRGTASDPFFNDNNLPAFVMEVFCNEMQTIMHQFFANYRSKR